MVKGTSIGQEEPERIEGMEAAVVVEKDEIKKEKPEEIIENEGEEVKREVSIRANRLLQNLHLVRKGRPAKKLEENNNDSDNFPLSDPEPNCFFCGAACTQYCYHCRRVSYCSQDHYQIHRPENYCYPFIVKTSPDVGRYCVATRDIKPCELILKEDPAALGPYNKPKPVCLQCFKQVDGSYLCPRCNFPMCGPTCASGNIHQQECDFFVSNQFKMNIKSFNKPNSNYFCITPLRMLLKKKNDPRIYKRINSLMDHMEERKSLHSHHINLMQMSIIMFLRKTCNTNEFTEEEIKRTIGILQTNGMKLEKNGSRDCPGVALYPIYCLFNHACYNNTNYVKFDTDLHLELRSQNTIKQGEEITTRYVSSTFGNVRRRDDIRQHWFFDCQCKRCCDVTEMGTLMSAVRCFDCPGYLLPRHSLEYDCSWSCGSCEAVVDANTIRKVIESIETQFSRKDRSMPDVLEELLYKHSSSLHPNHYILVEMEHSLVHAYASLPTLTRPQKERKIQLSHHVLEILGKVDPGYTKWRGALLHQMIQPLMTISKDDFKSGEITEKQLKRRLQYCMLSIAHANKCLNAGFSPGETQ